MGPGRDDWSKYLDEFAHSYNSGVQASTGFTPAYLLRGYQPREPETLMTNGVEPVPRQQGGNLDADEFFEAMQVNLDKAKHAIYAAQINQKRAYNQGRLSDEFEEGDLVLINPHSMQLTRDLEGKGRKLLPKYDVPFKILQKISGITYRLRTPSSYKIHPVISIAHLERYHESPKEFGDRKIRRTNRQDFNDLPEYEVEKKLSKRIRTRGRKRIVEYLVRFEGYDANSDEWLSATQLTNAPEVLAQWKHHQSSVYDDDTDTPDLVPSSDALDGAVPTHQTAEGDETGCKGTERQSNRSQKPSRKAWQED